jgi:hypothetical protein
MWPPVSRFAALLRPIRGIYYLKVCNALERVLGAFSARSGFDLFLHPAACFGILLRPSSHPRDKQSRRRESGATGPSFSPPPRTRNHFLVLMLQIIALMASPPAGR